MKRPGVSDCGGETLQRPSPVSQTTVCHFVSPSFEAETQAMKGHAGKRTPSKIQRVEHRKAALRKMAILKRKRKGLCLKLRGQGETEPEMEPGCAGKAVAGEQWELDSGFSSEVSPPTSGRSSPCTGVGAAQLVAMDCEMVGTGEEGRCSELARCSVVNYHGEVLYDQYIQPQLPVKDYRTRWSGICQHHLLHAVPFQQAREEVRWDVNYGMRGETGGSFRSLRFSKDTSPSFACDMLMNNNQPVDLPLNICYVC